MASIEQVLTGVQGISASSFASEAERVRARDLLFEALRRVQSPWDIVWEHNWVNLSTSACIRTLVEAGLFARWAEAGHGVKTSAQLAEMVGAEPVLVRRMVRHLAGQQLVLETDEDTFAPTAWAKALAEDVALTSTYRRFYGDLMVPMFSSLPAFLRRTGYANPTDGADGNWQFSRAVAVGAFSPSSSSSSSSSSSPSSSSSSTFSSSTTSSSSSVSAASFSAGFFADMGADPELAAQFHDAMKCHSRYNLSPWTEVYPTESIVRAAETRPGSALVVDVGGSRGHDLEKFLARHPHLPDGSLVLEDLPEVVSGLRLPAAIRAQPHDFFTEQPVRAARAYLMHNVLHDWPDDKAVAIMAAVTKAMEKGYSRLLIHESLISAVSPLARVTTSDITMMACVSAHERDEDEWRALIARAGLKVVKIWRSVKSVESVIETEVA